MCFFLNSIYNAGRCRYLISQEMMVVGFLDKHYKLPNGLKSNNVNYGATLISGGLTA